MKTKEQNKLVTAEILLKNGFIEEPEESLGYRWFNLYADATIEEYDEFEDAIFTVGLRENATATGWDFASKGDCDFNYIISVHDLQVLMRVAGIDEWEIEL